MATPRSRPRSADAELLALVPPALVPGLEAAAERAGFRLTLAPDMGAFLDRLRAGHRLATLVSTSADLVDERVIERIACEPRSGGLILSAPGASLERALLAERVGAIGLVREPIDVEDFADRLRLLLDEGDEVAVSGASVSDFELVGDGPAMAAVYARIARVARSRSTVLVTGESGTGKELVARAIHRSSERASGPFVPVNCAAIPEHLLESELFGHEKGAFTGAIASRAGRFERADGGSMLLDEIGDMSLVLQAKLLRALDERSVERVGGSGPRPVDVRVIAATHRDLRALVAERRFREDLYYRLAVIDLPLPPLRERGPDVRTLALRYTAHFADRHGRRISAITAAALERLEGYGWPGNVRELRNVIDRAVLLAGGPVLRTGHLRLGAAAPRASARGATNDAQAARPSGYPASFSLDEVEADHIARVLEARNGHVRETAEILGIHRNTLARKLLHHTIGTAGPEEA